MSSPDPRTGDAAVEPGQSSYGEVPPPSRSRRGGSVLAAAMLGLGEVLEPEKTKVTIEQASDDPFRDSDLHLTFDGLPSLDHL